MTLVTLIVIAASSLLFWWMDLDYPILTGIASGLLNMVPYIGAVMAWLPAFLLGLAKWKTIGNFCPGRRRPDHHSCPRLNFVAPQLVGRRVRLNAVAIHHSHCYFGAGSGRHGLILAIPITATLRVICDHTPSWRPIGRWLSALTRRDTPEIYRIDETLLRYPVFPSPEAACLTARSRETTPRLSLH